MEFDESTLLSLASQLYSAAADGDWAPALRAFLPLWSAEAGNILIAQDLIGAHEGLDGSIVRDYANHYWHLDKRRDLARSQLGRVLTNSRMGLHDSDIEGSEFFQDFSKRCYSFYALGLSFEVDGEVLSLSFHRLRPAGEFESTETAALEALQPHIVRAALFSRRFARLSRHRHHIEATLDQLPSALILLDAQGRPTFINRAAHRILATRDAIWIERGQLRGATASVTARLQAALANSRSSPSAKETGGPVLLPRRWGGVSIFAVCMPIGSGTHFADSLSGATVLYLRDPTSEPRTSASRLAATYKLTPAEARLAARIGQGESLEEAASALQVARETVRSQLRSIFQKTDTRKQTDLMRKLALDAALLPDPASNAPRDDE